MKKKNRILAICMAALLSAGTVTALSACGSEGQSGGSSAETSQASSQSSETKSEASSEASKAESKTSSASTEKATRTITDVLGRKVEIPTEIRSITCISVPASRMVIYTGGLDLIEGVSANEKQTDLTATLPLSVYIDKFLDMKTIGSGWPNSEIYQEEIVTLDSDVIVQYGSDPKAMDEMQEQSGIPVIGVMATDYMTDDFKQTMNLLGDVLGTKEHTDALLKFVDESIADLDKRTKDIPDSEKPTVYYGAVSFKGFNGIDATYAHYNPFDVIHAKNVADETGGSGAMTVEKEKITTWDPDILFVNQEGPTRQILLDDYKTNKAFYDNLSAVKNKKVYAQGPYNAVATNMEISLVNTYYAASVIYPEQFKDVDFEEKAKEILTMFLGEKGPDYLKTLEEQGLNYGPVTIFEG